MTATTIEREVWSTQVSGNAVPIGRIEKAYHRAAGLGPSYCGYVPGGIWWTFYADDDYREAYRAYNGRVFKTLKEAQEDIGDIQFRKCL